MNKVKLGDQILPTSILTFDGEKGGYMGGWMGRRFSKPHINSYWFFISSKMKSSKATASSHDDEGLEKYILKKEKKIKMNDAFDQCNWFICKISSAFCDLKAYKLKDMENKVKLKRIKKSKKSALSIRIPRVDFKGLFDPQSAEQPSPQGRRKKEKTRTKLQICIL